MKELILRRIKEIYKEYKEESEPNRFYNDDYLLDRYVLKVLIDIYRYDEEDEENRLIYLDWDIIECVIEDLVKEDGGNNESK